jgi:hypothetical protein
MLGHDKLFWKDKAVYQMVGVWMIAISRKISNVPTISWGEQVTLRWDDDVCFVSDQHT